MHRHLCNRRRLARTIRTANGGSVNEFLRALQVQRWDDHRYYHHSRINQALHLFSALSFVTAYAFLFIDPVVAALIAWTLSMTSRQAGHFFFEPKGYDEVNQATHEYKEEIKVGYNLRRKVVLMGLWAAFPVLLLIEPSLFGMVEPAAGLEGYMRQVGAAWLALGVGGLLFRTVHLFFLRDVQTGLVWATKILTDPFHDIKLYHRAPIYLLRGELIDPGMHRARG
jgi:ferric iron reductase protein FhuF